MDQIADITRRNELTRIVELERADARRRAIEHAASAVESCPIGGESYRKAFKAAAAIIRGLNV